MLFRNVGDYQTALCNVPKERGSHLLSDGSLKSRVKLYFMEPRGLLFMTPTVFVPTGHFPLGFPTKIFCSLISYTRATCPAHVFTFSFDWQILPRRIY